MISILDVPALTSDQQTALDAVRAKPGMTVDYYAGSFYLNEQMADALGFLIFNGFISRDAKTGALIAKG